MNRTEVKSSNIKSVGYDADAKMLEVEFIGGRVYQYLKIDENKYTDLMLAPSIGKFYAINIKNKFDWKALMDSEPKNLDESEKCIDVN